MTQNSITLLNPEVAVSQVRAMAEIVRVLRNTVLKDGVDFGKIPGTGDNPTLLLPGMEKLCRALNAVPEYIERQIIRDYDKPLFHYEYECRLIDADTGLAIPGGRGLGLCTSRESGFAWRWVQAHEVPLELDKATLLKRGGRTSEFTFAINKAETSGKYGKPLEYWQMFRDALENGTATRTMKDTKNGKSEAWEIDTTVYRIPNPDIYDQVNAIMKRAKKRSLGDAVKGAANVSEFFTVDLEDFATYDPHVVEGAYTVVKPQNGHEPETVSVEQSSAKVSVSPRPTPPPASPQASPAPNDVSVEPDPLAEFGMEAGATGTPMSDEDPRVHHCDILIVNRSKGVKQYALAIVNSRKRIAPVNPELLKDLHVGDALVKDLDPGNHDLIPSWSVYAEFTDAWHIDKIVTGMGDGNV